MPAPVAIDPGVDWRTIAVSACSLVVTILSILITGVRSEMRRQAEKLEKIDKGYIDRTEFKVELADVGRRIEDRHRENQGALKEISDKMDTYEEREASTRHAIRDSVNAVVIQQRVLEQKIELWRKEDERKERQFESVAEGVHALLKQARDKDSL